MDKSKGKLYKNDKYSNENAKLMMFLLHNSTQTASTHF